MSTVIDLSALGSRGFVIQGDAASDATGYSVSTAGDINGDGFDDIIVGAPFADDGTVSATGKAYVIFGKAGGFGTIDLGSLSASAGFLIEGSEDSDLLGFSVSTAGDINGDGFDDVVVASGGGSYYASSSDRYVIFGHASTFGTIDVGSLSASEGFTLQSDGGSFYDSGGRVSDAGDVNGDGFDDIIIGDTSDGDAGRAYVVFGKASGFGAVDLDGLASPAGFIIEGDDPSSGTGYAVASAGDMNGDGNDEIVVSAPWDSGGTDAGAVYVIFGKAGAFGTVDLGALSASVGFKIQGDNASDFTGSSVSTAGDFNGDGFADLIIGAPGTDAGGTNAGAAYIVFGKASGLGTLDLGTMSAASGFMIRGDSTGDSAGVSVSAAGDVNGDGFDDVIIGASGGDGGGTDAGEAYVIYGRASGIGDIDLTNLGPAEGFIIQGDSTGDFAGQNVSGGGDINGDGYDDLIVGAQGGDNGGLDAGEAYIIFGGRSGVTLVGTEAGETLYGTASGDLLDGRGGNDLLYGLAGADILLGGTGNDRLEGGAGIDRLYGGAGNDLFIVRDSTDYVFENPGEGLDTVHSTIAYTLHSNVERLTLTGTSAINGTGNDLANIVKGNSAANVLRGGGGDDKVYGGAGADAVRGGEGQDWLEGGAGRDRFYGDGGSDSFVFRNGDFSGVTSSTADQIHDFNDAEGDRVRLSLVDANTGIAGDQAFNLIGTSAFSHVAGELRYQQISGNTYVQGDTNGDGVADFWIRLDGLHTLASDDFVL